MGSRWATAWWLGPAVGIAAAVVITVSLWPGNVRPPGVTRVAPQATEASGAGVTPVTTTQVAPVEDSVWSMPVMPNWAAAEAVPAGGGLSVPAIGVSDLGGMPAGGGVAGFPAVLGGGGGGGGGGPGGGREPGGKK